MQFLPSLDSQDFRGLPAARSVCPVAQRKPASDIVFRSKTVTDLSAGCAVVASVKANSEVAKTIHESGAGAVIEPENADALLKAIHPLRSNNLDERRRFAREYAGFRWSSPRVLGSIEESLVALNSTVPPALVNEEAGR